MFHNFREIENTIVTSGIKRTIALAGAHDSYSLEAVVESKRKGLIQTILIGKENEIRKLLAEFNENAENYQIIHCEEDLRCTEIAVELIHKKKADIPMKGLLQTSDFMRPILNKTTGLLESGNVVSQATVVEYAKENRFFLITDCAINITPDVQRKKQIIRNAVTLTRRLGIETANVAVLSAVEKVNPKIISTVDAELLKKASEKGEFEHCIVSGPFALDNAISKTAAMHKGINDPVAGNADILLVPDLCVGNTLTKSLVFFTDMKSAGTLLGTKVPLIAASRTDTPENKYLSILLGLLMA